MNRKGRPDGRPFLSLQTRRLFSSNWLRFFTVGRSLFSECHPPKDLFAEIGGSVARLRKDKLIFGLALPSAVGQSMVRLVIGTSGAQRSCIVQLVMS